MRHKIKILAAAGLAMMLTGVSVLAFSEVSVLMQAVSGKVAIRLEEFMVERGKEVSWKENPVVLPGDRLSKIARIFNQGEECYIRAAVVFTDEKKSGNSLSQKNLTGISDDWIWKGEYCYYKKILPKGGKTDFFQGIQIPSEWKEGEDDDNHWNARVKVDAVQAEYFYPDFSSEDPWGLEKQGVEIQKSPKEEPADQTADQEPVILEIQQKMQGFSVETDEFFRKMETFLPGRAQTGSVTFENRTKDSREVFMRAEILEENEFLKELEVTIEKRLKDRTELLYQGTLLADQLENYQSIGKIPGEESSTLEFKITLPQEADNRYAAQQGKIKFWFTTDVSGKETPVPAVKTGDTVWRWGVAAALTLLGSLTVVGGILWKRYKKW